MLIVTNLTHADHARVDSRLQHSFFHCVLSDEEVHVFADVEGAYEIYVCNERHDMTEGITLHYSLNMTQCTRHNGQQGAVVQGRASDSRLRGPGFESCVVMLTRIFFNLHCSSSLDCVNEYLAIDKW